MKHHVFVFGAIGVIVSFFAYAVITVIITKVLALGGSSREISSFIGWMVVEVGGRWTVA